MTQILQSSGRFRLAVLFFVFWTISAISLFSSSKTTLIPIPKQTTDQCALHYSHFHLLFTIPPLAVLYFLASPFLTSLDWYKLYLLPIIAFIWTTPWDNELVRQEAWWYPTSCVLARIGYVPIEEYAFFILQSLLTTLLTILVTRWSTPRSSKTYYIAGLLPIFSATMVFIGLYSLIMHPDGQGSRYYLSMITWWACIPLTLLWWGTFHSWASVAMNGQVMYWLICVTLPTLYLCSADIYALRKGTWHISEKRSLQRFLVPDLPIEEGIFFMVTNLILASACFAFDRVVWQIRGEEVAEKNISSMYRPPLSPNYFALDWSTVSKICKTFIRLDVSNEETRQAVEVEAKRDYSLNILTRASKSFSTAATLLPWDLRVDLGSLYAFARTMDDFVDQPSTSSIGWAASGRIALLRSLAKIAFTTKTISNDRIQQDLSNALGKYRASGEVLTDQEEQDLYNSALSASLLRRIVPYRLWDDLINGYSLDSVSGGPHFTIFQEQADYAQSVAGAVGEMCVRVVLARIGILVSIDYNVPRDITRDGLIASKTQQEDTLLTDSQLQVAEYAPHLEAKRVGKILRDARRMGVSLQLVNIARDIVKDATELGRCYLVTGQNDFAGIRRALCNIQSTSIPALLRQEEKDKEEEKEVLDQVDPLTIITNDLIFLQKIHLLDVADDIYQSSIHSINLIPCIPARTGLRVACAVYANIGNVIRSQGAQKCMERSKATTLERLWSAFQAIYFM